MSTAFIGVDAGGTTTRALLAALDGTVLATGRGDGANAASSGTDVTAVIAGTIEQVLRDHDPASVAGGVIAIAGGGASSDEVAAELGARWRRLGLSGTPAIVIDVLAAFAAGTARPDGVVLAAGTGAVAAAIEGRRIVRRADGRGWLVGDAGSAVWLGIEGTRAALDALDGRGPETDLARSIPTALGVDGEDAATIADRIVRGVYGGTPASLGRLAPTVVEAAERGDGVATSIVSAAVEALTRTLEAVVGPTEPGIVVLAGSLLGRPEPLGQRLHEIVAARWPGARVRYAASGEAGAVLLAVAKAEPAAVGEPLLARLRQG